MTCPDPTACTLLQRMALRVDRLESLLGIEPAKADDQVRLLFDYRDAIKLVLEHQADHWLHADDLFVLRELLTRLNRVGFP